MKNFTEKFTFKMFQKAKEKSKIIFFLEKGLKGSISQIFLHIITYLEILNNSYLHFKI